MTSGKTNDTIGMNYDTFLDRMNKFIKFWSVSEKRKALTGPKVGRH